MTTVGLVHDYLTQRGGAERVVLALARAFPGAPVYTTLYDPPATFTEFAKFDVRTSWINRFGPLRAHHRLALPLLPFATSGMEVDADVTICSSSGWAHGARTTGRKIVYCYTPARWLYQPDRYVGSTRSPMALALRAVGPPLRAWDRRAAKTADRYIVLSRAVAERVRDTYGLPSWVVPAPSTFPVVGPASMPREAPAAGFVLCVSRLLPYKNVDAVVGAFRLRPRDRLVVAGGGPLLESLRAAAPSNVMLLGEVAEAELRWLYRRSRMVVAASYEDFGLTPIEGWAFGKPSVTLRWGGYVDTVVEGTNGLFFESPTPVEIAALVERIDAETWSEDAIRGTAAAYSEEAFAVSMRAMVDDVAAGVDDPS